ncbi:polysaccharide deacetylase family protein [Kitasatospora purpeofusca]|uniref:polysaccharide deacetylase family protein n=1 Tax=Kitasatospora purpeofusca TaxID=67352 RepID=UPI00224D2A05|nr:polysaccharide deacetylase family protein [Kitasatospora purpeofusca]MCX4683408.1 polysaccharide deacetylase family protein [Kitasatospora purpeofusca]
MGLTREGYRIAVADAGGGPSGYGPSGYGPSGMDEVYEHCGLERPLARLAELAGESPDGFAVVLDSANGIMDAPLAALGIPVLRADLPLLTDGRTTARSLAALGRSRPEALTALPPDSWTMAGREEGIAAAEAACGPVEHELAEQGLLLAGGGGADPLVALTFDDGPHPEYTPQVLDVLARYDAPAAFFCIGLHALAHPAVVRRIAAEGHILGNHSWSHAYLPDLGPIGLRAQLGFTADALAHACGGTRPSRWLRPPYGGRSPELLTAVAGSGLTTALWDVDAKDWSRPGAEVVAERVLSGVGPGSVVLMHDGGGDRSQTVAALPEVITGLRRRGYRIVGLDELLAARPVRAVRPAAPF